MATTGVEMLVGVVNDPVFGPVVACGAGGTRPRSSGDAPSAPPGDSRRDAGRDDPLAGHLPPPPRLPRSSARRPRTLADLVLRLGALADAHHEIVELDLNPVIASAPPAPWWSTRAPRRAAPPPRRPWPKTWR